MEHNMKLHQDSKLFSDTIRAAAQHLNIKLEFVEKDYWITLVLCKLSRSKFCDISVFKGGTSLSKGYNLIERFSEDVDLAIIDDGSSSGNQVRTIIRTLEKEITNGLNEVSATGITSKGSRFRKSVFEYPSINKINLGNNLIVEINSFANPFPYKRLTIKSMVYDFLIQTGYETYINQFDLNPFEVNVLSEEQTLLEKLASLIRFSFNPNPIDSVSQKIRHFYDLYYLMNKTDCALFVSSQSFKHRFEEIIQHDRQIFDEPVGWQSKQIIDSPLVNDFDKLWAQLKFTYQTELSAYAYRTIPNEVDVSNCFKKLIKQII
jgi:predicted nucleotidyltransferase component of viral defense system